MQTKPLTIGALAHRADVTPDTLRYYEQLGLLPAPPRTSSGYRLYEPAIAERVAFIRKAQVLGLSLEDVSETLRVADAGTPPCEHVRAALERRLQEVEARIADLESLRRTLAQALRRNRNLPRARSCVCEIIESQDLPPSDRRRSSASPHGRQGRDHPKKENV